MKSDLRAVKEDRKALRRDAEALMRRQRDLAKDEASAQRGAVTLRTAAPTADLTPDTYKLDIAAFTDEKVLRNLDNLYYRRVNLEEKITTSATPALLTCDLVNLQRDICLVFFGELHKVKDKSGNEAAVLASDAGDEIRRYNKYLTRFGDLTGIRLAPAPLTLPADILAGKSVRTMSRVSYHEPRRSAPDVAATGFRPLPAADAVAHTEEAAPLTAADIRRYMDSVVTTVRDLQKQREDLRKSGKNVNNHAAVRIQSDIVGVQKEICETYLRLFNVAHENGLEKTARPLLSAATSEYRRYNREIDILSRWDGCRHTHINPSTPDRALSGKDYADIPTVVCALPGKGGNTAFLTGSDDTDVAVVESRYAYRIRQMEESLRSGKYDFVLFKEANRRTTQSKRGMLSRLKAESRIAADEERRDNRRYAAFLSTDPSEKTKRGRVRMKETAKLQRELAALLEKRDDINRELLALYAADNVKMKMRTVETYGDEPVAASGSDNVPTLTKDGTLVRTGKSTRAGADAVFAKKYETVKARHFRTQGKYVAKLAELRLPKDNADVRRLYELYNRRVELLTRIDTTEDKIRIYKLRGRPAGVVREEKRKCLSELRRVNREIDGRTRRARVQAEQKARLFWE